MLTRVELGSSVVAIVSDADGFGYVARGTASASLPAWRSSDRLAPRSATIDMFRAVGGLPQRALIGGTRSRGSRSRLVLTVPTSGETGTSRDGAGDGLLRGRLLPGLPDEFAQPALAGLLSSSTTAGEVRITAAAHDVEQTSSVAVLAAARILSLVLHAMSDELSDREVEAVRSVLRGGPGA